MIADNTIVSADLRDGQAVRSVDIVDGQVNTADLANNAVTSDKIASGEVKAEDLDPSIELGGNGGGTPNFSLQVTERSNTVQFGIDDNGPYTVSVQCNSDEVVTGGGFNADVIGSGVGTNEHLYESKKQDNGWSVSWHGAQGYDLTAYAECMKVVPTAAE
jgi:hypothetical protein